MEAMTLPELYLHPLLALVVGAALGLERSYHSRPAGFRTHALVCFSSALLMVATLSYADWVRADEIPELSIDPTRVIEGIMTGIGFLGAGTIIKEGFSVRGLTTAASVWSTAAVGVLFGVGLLLPALLASLMVLATLSAFRWIEAHVPAQIHVKIELGFDESAAPSDDALRKLVHMPGVSLLTMSQTLDRAARRQDYRLMMRAKGEPEMGALVSHLKSTPDLLRFRIDRRLS